MHEQAVALAEARAQLAAAKAASRTEVASLQGELLRKERLLEEKAKQWRCHRHDGETRTRLLEEQLTLLAAKSDPHTALATTATQLSKALLNEASMRMRLAEAEGALKAAEGREATLRAAASAALASEGHVAPVGGVTAGGAVTCGGAGAEGGGGGASAAGRLTEGLLLKQRDEINNLKHRLASVAVSEQVGRRPEQRRHLPLSPCHTLYLHSHPPLLRVHTHHPHVPICSQVSIAQSEVDAESSSLAANRASALESRLALTHSSLQACEVEKATLLEALKAFDAREAARALEHGKEGGAHVRLDAQVGPPALGPTRHVHTAL